MLISEVMSTDVKIASPKQSIQDAALMMVEIDAVRSRSAKVTG
jgi:hypothetical protein